MATLESSPNRTNMARAPTAHPLTGGGSRPSFTAELIGLWLIALALTINFFRWQRELYGELPRADE